MIYRGGSSSLFETFGLKYTSSTHSVVFPIRLVQVLSKWVESGTTPPTPHITVLLKTTTRAINQALNTPETFNIISRMA